jgi:general secretion pathway protein D
VRFITACGVIALLSACTAGADRFAYHDRDARLSRADIRDGFAPRPEAEAAPTVAIPPLAPVAEPVVTTLPSAVRLLTVQSDPGTPVRDLLLAMARTAGVDADIDPAVQGTVLISATDRPFLEIVERVAERTRLRWSFEDGYLKVEPDTPVLRSYRIDHLNLIRETQSSVSTAASVSSSAGGGGGGGAGGNSSASSVTGQGQVDFWTELTANIAALLGVGADGMIPVVQTAQADEPTEAEAAAGGAGGAGAAAAGGLTGMAQSMLAGVTGDAASGNTGAGTAAAGAGAGGAASASADDAGEDGAADDAAPRPTVPADLVPQFTVNRQAGLLTIRATDRQHRMVAEYLRMLRRTVNAQVLIEARVVEVLLEDGFESGINWRSVFGGVFEAGASFGTIVSEPPFTGTGGGNIVTPGRATLALSNNDITAVANLVQRFGTVRTLSSPRVTVVQNQTAVLKVAENQVFFRLEFQTQQSQNGGLSTTTVSSDINTVPVGVIITVQPSINTETDRISLAVRPTVTRIVEFLSDPAVAIASENRVQSRIPVVAVQELDSVVTMGSGQVLVMGGLMQDTTRSTDEGLPVAGEVPLLGSLFKSRDDETVKSELVIFLKATIVDGGILDEYDREFYRNYGRDRRPL